MDIHPEGYDLEQVEYYIKNTSHAYFISTLPSIIQLVIRFLSSSRKRLVELAEHYRFLIIEDDAYHDIYFDQAPPPPIYTFDSVGTVIYIRSFCKYISPGLRIATVICPSSLMKSLLTENR